MATCQEERIRWQTEHPHLLVAERVKRSDLPHYNRRRQALAWRREACSRHRLVQPAFRELGYPDLETACAEHDGFTVTRSPTSREKRRVAILETVARALLLDLFDQLELPPCHVIDNRRAVWAGMTTCIRVTGAGVRWRGLRIRYRLPYVYLKGELLADGSFADAISTYLHELAHMFGGDSSATFSHALSELLAVTCAQASAIVDYQERWDTADCAVRDYIQSRDVAYHG